MVMHPAPEVPQLPPEQTMRVIVHGEDGWEEAYRQERLPLLAYHAIREVKTGKRRSIVGINSTNSGRKDCSSRTCLLCFSVYSDNEEIGWCSSPKRQTHRKNSTSCSGRAYTLQPRRPCSGTAGTRFDHISNQCWSCEGISLR